MHDNPDLVNAAQEAASVYILGGNIRALVKMHENVDSALDWFNDGSVPRGDLDEYVAFILELLQRALEIVREMDPLRPTVELLHIFREAEELQLASLQRWSLAHDGFTRLLTMDMEAAQQFSDASAPWQLRQRRALDALTLMLQFLERDDPELLDEWPIDPDTKEMIGLGQQALGSGPPTTGPAGYSYYWEVHPVPSEPSTEHPTTVPSLLLTSPLGSRAEAYCHELAAAGRDQFQGERWEFTTILGDFLNRLGEPGPGRGDLFSALASVILGRDVDLSATNTKGVAPGPPPWRQYYPTLGVDLSVPQADNQWYLLPWPERTVLLRTLKDHLHWSQVNFSTVEDGTGIHADILAWTWLRESFDGSDDPDFGDLPDPTDPRFGQLVMELDQIAMERDAALSQWEQRVRERVGSP